MIVGYSTDTIKLMSRMEQPVSSNPPLHDLILLIQKQIEDAENPNALVTISMGREFADKVQADYDRIIYDIHKNRAALAGGEVRS